MGDKLSAIAGDAGHGHSMPSRLGRPDRRRPAGDVAHRPRRRLSGDREGGRRRRGGAGCASSTPRRRCSTRSPSPAPRPARHSATTRSTWKSISRTRGISSSRCLPTPTATSSISASATARCSAGTRRCSRKPRRPESTRTSRQAMGARCVDACREIGYRGGGNLRVPVRRRQVLLHRDEYPAAGRASGDGARHRHRHRQGPASYRGGRGVAVRPGRRTHPRPRGRVPHQCRASDDVPPFSRDDLAVPPPPATPPADPVSGSTATSTPATRSRPTTTR